MITPAQIREARTLVGWRTPMLARRAGVGSEIVAWAQKEGSWPPVAGMDLRAIRGAFECAGLILIETNGGGAGVQMRNGVQP